VICREHLSRLLRYGRKNDGGWNECDHADCEQLDDGDVDEIIEALILYREYKSNNRRYDVVVYD
jgi:hypothetical protein